MKPINIEGIDRESLNFHKIIALPITSQREFETALIAMQEARKICDGLRKSLMVAAENESLIADKAARYAVREGLAIPVRSYLSWNDPDYKGNDPTYCWYHYDVNVGDYLLHITATVVNGKRYYLWS